MTGRFRGKWLPNLKQKNNHMLVFVNKNDKYYVFDTNVQFLHVTGAQRILFNHPLDLFMPDGRQQLNLEIRKLSLYLRCRLELKPLSIMYIFMQSKLCSGRLKCSPMAVSLL